MMKKSILLLSASLLLALGACKKKTDPVNTPSTPGYVVEVRSADGNVFGLHPVSDLTTGEAEISEASEGLFNFYIGDWDANGALYSRDWDPHKFVKYKYDNGGINITQTVAMQESYDPSANVRLDADRVWFVRKIDGNTVYWDVLNTTSMTFENSGSFTLPVKSGYRLGAGFASKHGDKLILGYHQKTDDANKIIDSVYIAVLDGINFTVQSLDKDFRSAGAGCSWSSSSFTTENGDTYFLNFPYAYVGNNPAEPSGIMRVQNGQTTIDDSYFFDVSDVTGGNNFNGPSIYMGNNKVLVQIVREDLVVNGDYWGADPSAVFQNEYYVLDLVAKSATKLNVPLSRGNGDGNPIKISDELYAFAVNEANGNFVYTYNTSTGEVKQGLKYIGALVIYKLHSLK